MSSDSLSPSHEDRSIKKTFQNSVSISFLKNQKLLMQSFKRYKLPTLTLYLDVDCRSIIPIKKMSLATVLSKKAPNANAESHS